MNDGAPTGLIPAYGQRRALVGIALSQLLVLTLWFSAAAVAPQLREQWGLSVGHSLWLSLAVQIGFVVGARVPLRSPDWPTRWQRGSSLRSPKRSDSSGRFPGWHWGRSSESSQ